MKHIVLLGVLIINYNCFAVEVGQAVLYSTDYAMQPSKATVMQKLANEHKSVVQLKEYADGKLRWVDNVDANFSQHEASNCADFSLANRVIRICKGDELIGLKDGAADYSPYELWKVTDLWSRSFIEIGGSTNYQFFKVNVYGDQLYLTTSAPPLQADEKYCFFPTGLYGLGTLRVVPQSQSDSQICLGDRTALPFGVVTRFMTRGDLMKSQIMVEILDYAGTRSYHSPEEIFKN